MICETFSRTDRQKFLDAMMSVIRKIIAGVFPFGVIVGVGCT